MKAYDFYKKALLRLHLEKFEEKLCDSALEFMNEIAADLKIGEIKTLNCELELSTELKEGFLSGLVMLLSLAVGDTQQNSLYTELYNAKRAKILSVCESVEDRLPTCEGGI